MALISLGHFGLATAPANKPEMVPKLTNFRQRIDILYLTGVPFPIAGLSDALSTADAKAKLDGDIQLHFGAAPKGTISQPWGIHRQ
ncbi:hypothetical protein [Microbulbifer rhizosphaerae]|uniref:Uncharacterized protein n=1 Tax=Microbulbifer rhizosphaerae TaxID=1562603 RepID=A0A7W4WEN6_9GAMM|nr:hypothetical protein [Microbulbifer rhizosphaerae]MBB3062867.1 hypothetical protein [Microbulbifer rhizosphaerae]